MKTGFANSAELQNLSKQFAKFISTSQALTGPLSLMELGESLSKIHSSYLPPNITELISTEMLSGLHTKMFSFDQSIVPLNAGNNVQYQSYFESPDEIIRMRIPLENIKVEII